MLGIKYFKADSSTYVLKTVDGEIVARGRGLSFFYNTTTTSVAAVPVNAQEAPFIFKLQTSDFQSITVQGQITFQISDPEQIAELFNFSLAPDGRSHVSEDPLAVPDKVVRNVQSIVQHKVQATKLRDSLTLSQELTALIRNQLISDGHLADLGITPMNVVIGAIQPTPETAKALEAEARELILKEADDAIYARRKSAVEQERMIREAELQTDLSVQQKQQEIEESKVQNKRVLLKRNIELETERMQANIEAEKNRNALVDLEVQNGKLEADAGAYEIAERMKAFRELPVANLKAMAMANMQPEQLVALAIESLAENASKIGELNISPDLLNQFARKVKRA